MKKIQWPIWLKFMFLLFFVPVGVSYALTGSEAPGDERPVLVGRISHVEGDVNRYVVDEEAWNPVVMDEPFGMDDVLESGRDGRAEAILPNNTWIRIGADTRIQLTLIEPGATGADVDSGVARFSNRNSDTVLNVTTPFGYVTAQEGTAFDLYVHLASIQVIAQRGTVEFVHNLEESRFAVTAGSTSLLANARRVEVRKDYGDPEWEAWNRARDRLWSVRMARRGPSVDYLPPSLYHDAYVLDDYGRWVRVYYEGSYRYFWRPVYVDFRWAPFTVGRWSRWRGSRSWLPGEPFGYVTHHYGNWIMVRGLWYWAPPVSRIRVRSGPPLLNIAFSWSPGRVGWVDYGTRVGWFVLAPHEHYRWRPHKNRHRMVAGRSAASRMLLRQKSYRYRNHAVITEKKKLYGGYSFRNRVKARHRKPTLGRKHLSSPRILNHRLSKEWKEKARKHFRENPSPNETRLRNGPKKRPRIAQEISRERTLEKAKWKGNRTVNRLGSRKNFGRHTNDTHSKKARLKSMDNTRSKGGKVRKRSLPMKRYHGPKFKSSNGRTDYLKRKSGLSKRREVRTARKASPKIMKKRSKPWFRDKATTQGASRYFKKAKPYRNNNQMKSGAFFSRVPMKNSYRRFNNRITDIGSRNR